MASKGSTAAVLIGAVAIGGLIYFLTRPAAAATATNKFKVGDQITAVPVLETNVIYQITAVDTATETYAMAQVYLGQLVNYDSGYPWSVIDTHYVLV